MKIAIYGAKSLALGMYRAIELLYPGQDCIGFVVNSMENNPSSLAGLSVVELEKISGEMSVEDKSDLHILICTPEDTHPAIEAYLQEHGFNNYTCMDSRKEARLMERYFVAINQFKSLHTLSCDGIKADGEGVSIEAYQAKFYKDRPLKNTYDLPEWIIPIQVGATLTDVRITDVCDDQGDNISAKNVNYCELTALYWLWKNRLLDVNYGQLGYQQDGDMEGYYGLCHYRRILDIDNTDILRLQENDVDIVASYPTLHEPDIKEHHARHLSEEDWEAMLQALEELQPDYRVAYEDIFSQEYLYNYNMMIAKRSVLVDYCAWLFPILERTEELTTPRGWERSDRYIGYMGENLMTLYLLYNKDRLNIVHTGRLMLT